MKRPGTPETPDRDKGKEEQHKSRPSQPQTHIDEKEKEKEKKSCSNENDKHAITADAKKNKPSSSKDPHSTRKKWGRHSLNMKNLENASKEELLDEITRHKEQLKDMTESKYALMKSSREEIERLHGYIAKLRKKESVPKYYAGIYVYIY
ncbi:hypothetical protein RFI_13764 [Reticulomyxa filosa]|uniref:Uncharacterized protein n=1 Tax=Reticulomyxa filosa TaxID=46433 RepID=X6NBQ6_RETFI|nr:hypothetical protein RFI_13764 [Reticulomyxa filosa]|eukprot:ETO23416.1 hypothetical protein RFI_13764 [Reticulomyxa filosa]